VRFDQRDTNLTLLKTSGVDFSIYYNAKLPKALPGDRINITFQGGTVDSFVRLLFPSDNLFDCAGDFGGGACSDAGTGIRAIPAFRSNLAVAWMDGPLTIRGAWRYQGQVDALIKRVPEPQWRNVAANTNNVQHIDAWDYFDLGFSYKINDNLRIGGTVSNLFDKEPPILGSAQQDANTLPNQYDIIGRRYAINLVWRM
jgi:outer membrane receptor protein involved in Fe transport